MGHLTRGRGMERSQPSLQQTAAGTEAKEMSLECHPSGDKGMGGEDTPSEPESLVGDDKEEDEYGVEGKVTPPPHAPPHESLPSLGDIFSRQAGITVSAR
jgi:hypothetical protein